MNRLFIVFFLSFAIQPICSKPHWWDYVPFGSDGSQTQVVGITSTPVEVKSHYEAYVNFENTTQVLVRNATSNESRALNAEDAAEAGGNNGTSSEPKAEMVETTTNKSKEVMNTTNSTPTTTASAHKSTAYVDSRENTSFADSSSRTIDILGTNSSTPQSTSYTDSHDDYSDENRDVSGEVKDFDTNIYNNSEDIAENLSLDGSKSESVFENRDTGDGTCNFWFFLVIAVTLFDGLFSNAPNIDYSHNMRVLKLPKSIKPGTIIYRLKGSDPDAEPLNFGIKGAVGRKLLDIVSVSFNEADVYLKSSLEETEYTVTIYVSDGKESTEVESTILVTQPTEPIKSAFIDLKPLFTISENAKSNETVGVIAVRERENSNLAVIFEMKVLQKRLSDLSETSHFVTFQNADKFSIRYIFGPKGTSTAVISLLKPLDYEKQKLYFVTVVAINGWTNESVDTRNIMTEKIVIAVEDVEDTPPRFETLPSVIKLTQENEAGNVVATVRAEDGDYGIQRPVEYQISKSAHSSIFAINRTTGEIHLTKSFDEIKSEVGVDNPFLVTIKAKEVSEKNDDENEDETLTTTTADLTVVLLSTVNNLPKFASEKLIAFIDENSPIGTAVKWKRDFVPRVTDLDSGINGSIILNSDTGLLKLESIKGIDRENVSEYTLNVEVRDDNGAGNQNVTTVKVKVLDSNDNEPKFLQSKYFSVLNEQGTDFIQRLIVKAIDKDEPGTANSNVTYEIIAGNIADKFSINAFTGEISIKHSEIERIDSEKIVSDNSAENLAQLIRLSVRAHDSGIPYRSSTTEVYIFNQNFVNRTVRFLLNGSERSLNQKWQEIERLLNSVTGAKVHVYSIHSPANEKAANPPSHSVVDAWVIYPVDSVADLRKVPLTSGKESVTTESNVQIASVHKSEYDVVFWVLVALIIITICFIILLLIILCIYCRTPKSKREKIIEIHKNGNFNVHESQSKAHMNGAIAHKASKADKRFGSKQERGRLSKNSVEVEDEVGDDSSYSPDLIRYAEGPSKTRRWKMSKRRVGPELLTQDTDDVEAGYFDNDYYMTNRNIPRKERSSFRDSHSNTGTFIMNQAEGSNRKTHLGVRQSDNSKKTEIMYIRSPVHSSYNENVRSVSENDMRFDDEETLFESEGSSFPRKKSEVNPEQHRRQVSFSDVKEAAPDSVSQKSLKFRSRRSVSQITLAGTVPEENEAAIVMSNKSSPSIHTSVKSRLSMNNVLPGSVESEESHSKTEPRVQTEVSETEKDVLKKGEIVGEVDKSRDVQSSAMEQKESVKETQTSEESEEKDKEKENTGENESLEKSDSDSGIGRSQIKKDLQLKNMDLMAKKSIFTIVYDTMRTDRIRSPESCPPSP
ncbi:cadherin-86C-like protein [Dinothrombium tinctorium]|uniref:Cadherin-86C-like protein n=1 Tax=Dinothrombium tinctorium TaxID=1965070 RepID=A0A3S3Q298_9ACAR|nr:cadherin-86C-like protein [Dinothrombium tinctorium]RWS12562.1 cadherin-86C-like protein [Dinothrombium tinctorium]RWS13339.1 cadherin-86C-like protein [Dinothrombium tinctorium]RWS13346.1 cadherin-86C-like protein [Dinothrombium tinctorium]